MPRQHLPRLQSPCRVDMKLSRNPVWTQHRRAARRICAQDLRSAASTRARFADLLPDLGLHELGQQNQGLLPAEVAALHGDHAGNAFLNHG